MQARSLYESTFFSGGNGRNLWGQGSSLDRGGWLVKGERATGAAKKEERGGGVYGCVVRVEVAGWARF